MAKTCNNGHKYTGDKCPYCPGQGGKGKRDSNIFGTTIRETVRVFSSIGSSEKSQKISSREKYIILSRTIASLVLAGVAIYLFNDGRSEAGFGLGGSIVGYWLK